MSELGILFLPSGPGLSSGPAREFLEATLPTFGKTVFWDEPSAQRGEMPAEGSAELVDQILRSIDGAVEALPDRFVVVTESFGSLIAETYLAYDRKKARPAKHRISGVLHTPPVLDLVGALKSIIAFAAEDFSKRGEKATAERLRGAIAGDTSIGSGEFGEALDLAFTSPVVLPSYFVTQSGFQQWAKGFSRPGLQPDAETRSRILQCCAEGYLPTKTTLLPDLPTWVFGGAGDPYRKVVDFEAAVAAAKEMRARPEELRWVPFENSRHYPYIDEPKRWREAFSAFFDACAARRD